MNRRLLIFSLVALTLALLAWRPWRARFGYHFDFPLPSSATLVNHHYSGGFLDSSHAFEFAVTDDALRDAILKEWKIDPAGGREPMSFSKFAGAPWWPAAGMESLPERHGRVEEGASRYWSVWVDREKGRVYAEYGDW